MREGQEAGGVFANSVAEDLEKVLEADRAAKQGGVLASPRAVNEQGFGDFISRRIEDAFSFHPDTMRTGPLHDTVRAILKGTAHALVSVVPEGREQSLMLTALEEAMMWANAGVARHG